MGMVNPLFSAFFPFFSSLFLSLHFFLLSPLHFFVFLQSTLTRCFGMFSARTRGRSPWPGNTKACWPGERQTKGERNYCSEQLKIACGSCLRQSALEMGGSARYIWSTALPGTVAKAKIILLPALFEKNKTKQELSRTHCFPFCYLVEECCMGNPFCQLLPSALPAGFSCLQRGSGWTNTGLWTLHWLVLSFCSFSPVSFQTLANS